MDVVVVFIPRCASETKGPHRDYKVQLFKGNACLCPQCTPWVIERERIDYT